MHFRNIYMKKVLIIGYGDLGQRISSTLPDHQFIGISRSNHVQDKNSEWLPWDWFSGEPFKLKHQEISTVIIILKPISFDEEGYQQGFLAAANSIMTNLNAQINYEQLVIVSSTRVYGNSNGQNITEEQTPQPENFRGKVILNYEAFIKAQSKVEPLILRASGLYDGKHHWMQNFVNSFESQKFQLKLKAANRFDRNALAEIISNYLTKKKLSHLAGVFICSEISKGYAELFREQCPGKVFEDYFIPSDQSGKSFDPQKLIDSGLMG
jgi:dTDP-4-dehydrorhamnose reductase